MPIQRLQQRGEKDGGAGRTGEYDGGAFGPIVHSLPQSANAEQQQRQQLQRMHTEEMRHAQITVVSTPSRDRQARAAIRRADGV